MFLELRIEDSLDTSFEHVILKETRGNGVDIVLYPLAEKQWVSLRCLAPSGVFLKICKRNQTENGLLHLETSNKNCSIHFMCLDEIFNFQAGTQITLKKLIGDGIKGGYVRPLSRICVEESQAKEVYKTATDGKHMGEMLIKIREEESEKPHSPCLVEPLKGLPRLE